MATIDYKERFLKALKGGNELLKHAQRLDAMADENPDIEKALQQRAVATILRSYYEKMFE